MQRITDDEWRDALDVIPRAIAAAGLEHGSGAADLAHDYAVDALMKLRKRYVRQRGTFRQFTFRSVRQAVQWAKGRSSKKSKSQAKAQEHLRHVPRHEVADDRFESEQLSKLPESLRRAVVLYVHLDLSLRDTGILLGGISHARVRSRLRRAGVLMGQLPDLPARQRRRSKS